MSSEEQQEQAALYALGTLDLDEATAFEREMAANGELRLLAAELRETLAALARAEVGNIAPPPDLKARVLARTQAETPHYPEAGNGAVLAGPWRRWLPWAIAAALALSCGKLASDNRSLASANESQHLRFESAKRSWDEGRGVFRQVVFCTLEPVPTAQQTGPQAAVLWDAAHRRGRLHLTRLPAAGEGKDYQLWTVETGRKDSVSAGLVKVGPDDSADIEFQPEADDGKGQVVAFALSRERAGGVPKNEGPILFLGKLSP